ncbi:MAG: hypothetical protein E7015_00200 [Alphaproteobacteria bacterium]|nr:hypothetical protein [Alphaproteobacteria bacterium]
MKKNILTIVCIASVFGMLFESEAAAAKRLRRGSASQVIKYTPDPAIAEHQKNPLKGSTPGGYNDDTAGDFSRFQTDNNDLSMDDLTQLREEKNRQLERTKITQNALGKRLGVFKKGKNPEYLRLSQEIKDLETGIKDLDKQIKGKTKNIAKADKYTLGMSFSKAVTQWKQLNEKLTIQIEDYANNLKTYTPDDTMLYPKAFLNVLAVYNLYLQSVGKINDGLMQIVKNGQKATNVQMYMLREDVGLLVLQYNLLKASLIELQKHVNNSSFNNRDAMLITVERFGEDIQKSDEQLTSVLSQLESLNISVAPEIWADIRGILPGIYEDSAKFLKQIYETFRSASDEADYQSVIESVGNASERLSAFLGGDKEPPLLDSNEESQDYH